MDLENRCTLNRVTFVSSPSPILGWQGVPPCKDFCQQTANDYMLLAPPLPIALIKSATVMCTIGPMVVPNPVIAARATPLRFPISLSGNTQADDTQSYSGLGAVRNVGLHLGRIPDSSEVPRKCPK